MITLLQLLMLLTALSVSEKCPEYSDLDDDTIQLSKLSYAIAQPGHNENPYSDQCSFKSCLNSRLCGETCCVPGDAFYPISCGRLEFMSEAEMDKPDTSVCKGNEYCFNNLPASYQNGTLCEQDQNHVRRIAQKRCKDLADARLKDAWYMRHQVATAKDRLRISNYVLQQLKKTDCGRNGGYHRVYYRKQ